jgi:hypothetical protein
MHSLLAWVHSAPQRLGSNPGRSFEPLIAQLGDADAAEALPLVELAQARDGFCHADGGLGSVRYQPRHRVAVAGDRDLFAGADGIEQGRQMGFGFESTDAADGDNFN